MQFVWISFLLVGCVWANSPNTIKPLNCDCLPNTSNRIVGGQYAEPYEYPWQASLGLKITDRVVAHICGATILNAEWVMTAAHCALATTNVSELSVGFGNNNLRAMKPNKRINVVQKIVHPKYNPKDASSLGDIALLRLARPLPLDRRVKPACLHPNMTLFNEQIEKNRRVQVVATGWGSVKKTYRYLLTSRVRGGQIQPHLKKANFWAIRADDSKTCKRRQDLLCIDSVVSGDSVCNGDSGGPLNYVVSSEEEVILGRANRSAQAQSTRTQNQQSNSGTTVTSLISPDYPLTLNQDQLRRVAVVGVTSFGVGVFNFPNIIRIDFCSGPAVYTRVPYFNDFINEHINQNQLCYA